jgi:hypothetical protein
MPVQNFFNGPEAAQAAQQKLAQQKPPFESKDISALASLIKAIKPEAASAVSPILDYIFANLPMPQQQELMSNLPKPPQGGEPLEPSGGERVPVAKGSNDPGMPNVEAMPQIAVPEIRPNQI